MLEENCGAGVGPQLFMASSSTGAMRATLASVSSWDRAVELLDGRNMGSIHHQQIRKTAAKMADTSGLAAIGSDCHLGGCH